MLGRQRLCLREGAGADRWWPGLRNLFAWEYKGPHVNLDSAYGQLQMYKGGLQNPPRLIVCDFDRAFWAACGCFEQPEETDDATIRARMLALKLERTASQW